MFDVVSILGQMAESSADPRIRNIVKSLTSTQAGTQLSSLTGGGAMRVESVESELAIATVQNPHFVLFNKLFPNRHTSWSLIDQQVVQDGIGGFPGGSIANEKATNLPDRNGNYRREVTELKLFAEYGGITVPTALQGALQQAAGVVDFNSAEQEIFSALSRVLQSIEWSLLYGDASIDTLEFTGLIPSIKARSAVNVVDLRGAALNSGAQVAPLAAQLSGFGNWGSPDCLIVSPLTKADFDTHLESSYRVNLDNNVPSTVLGALVRGIRYNGLGVGKGILDLEPHPFLDERIKAPVSTYADASAVTGQAPVSLTAGVPAANPASKFLAAHAGAYYYAVEGCSAGVVSNPTVSGAVTVAAGDRVTLTIAASAGSAETYYKVFRGRKGGTNAPSDMRLIGRVVKTGATTTFIDDNVDIPGTSDAIMCSCDPNVGAIRLLQMAPPSKLPLALTALEYRFVMFYIAALRVATPKKLGLVKNILPSNKIWDPFN